MLESEARSIAKTAAQEVLAELFLRLGIDVTDPTEVQKDMAFLHNWRQSCEAIKRQSILTAIGVVVVGILGLIWVTVRG